MKPEDVKSRYAGREFDFSSVAPDPAAQRQTPQRASADPAKEASPQSLQESKDQATFVGGTFGEDAKPVVLTNEERDMLTQYRKCEQHSCNRHYLDACMLDHAANLKWAACARRSQMLSRILAATEPEEGNG